MRCSLLSLFICSILLAACNAGDQAREENASDNNNKPITVKNSVNENSIDTKNGQEIAQHLVGIANRIPDVNDAAAVVLGNTAVVGIDVNAELDRNKVESIKYAVSESLTHDRYGENAIVIADADTTVRLRKMGEEIQNGRPVAGVLDELAAIVGRLMPDAPSDIIDNQEESPTEQDNDQLNEQEQQNLNQQQDSQSNHYMKQNQQNQNRRNQNNENQNQNRQLNH
ncbi:YhcN/YlaJ family sporulation lipoprotein [Bacillus lacus]|uniref:YhcN/YlaJ family sporulation lipoprotein n=1 Tax=Metabacillus lacus TaxID=1983721 RepID=A0A7X2IY95_9BACI|nr:YhcN/YlaJ family sporulation lipoprotein [Metabacillus lacus]MRX71682.1 YhcN/YlaJ family sporulation lipoprotein [Metabacillus lacus]